MSSGSGTGTPPLHYALLLFPQWELLDAAGPVEALQTLARLPADQFPHGANMTLSIIAPSLEPIGTGPVTSRPAESPQVFPTAVETRMVPTHTYDDLPKQVDVLIVPGGFGTGPSTLIPGWAENNWEPPVEGAVGVIRTLYPKLQQLLSESDVI
jgi:hypothetical protein